MEKFRLGFQVVDGIKIPPFFSKECFESALRFRPQSGDIFVATYPKCGTTWMQNVVINVLRRGKPLDKPQDFFLASPFLDQLGADDSQKMMIRPGAYKTHLPFSKVPWSEDSKYIYVARNPKDCSVSFYHHMKQIPGYQFSRASFNDFFEMFVEGDLEFNDYFDHLLSWYNEKDRPNIFFTTYETMKMDLRDVILKVAKFLNVEDLEENPKVLEEMLQNCSFQNMKFINVAINSMYSNTDHILADPHMPKGRKYIAKHISKLPGYNKNIEFIRKGEIGDWRNVYTEEQNERINKRIHKTLKYSNVMMLWNDIM